MKAATACLALATVLASHAGAQSLALAGRASPNPAPLGTTITFTLESTAVVMLSSGCVINEIRSGSPTGAVVWQPFICPAVLIQVNPGAPLNTTWNQLDSVGQPVPGGDYYARFSFWDQNFGVQTHRWVPFRISDPLAPAQATLAATGFPTRGSVFNLSITDTANPGAVYVAAASFTTDTGWTVAPGFHIALDQDALWNLSFPAAHPALFAGFTGSLDASGFTNVPMVFVPQLAQLQGLPFAVQAVVLGAGGAVLTNPLTTVIR